MLTISSYRQYWKRNRKISWFGQNAAHERNSNQSNKRWAFSHITLQITKRKSVFSLVAQYIIDFDDSQVSPYATSQTSKFSFNPYSSFCSTSIQLTHIVFCRVPLPEWTSVSFNPLRCNLLHQTTAAGLPHHLRQYQEVENRKQTWIQAGDLELQTVKHDSMCESDSQTFQKQIQAFSLPDIFKHRIIFNCSTE